MRNSGYLTAGGGDTQPKNLSLLLLAWQLSMLRRHCSRIADIEIEFFVLPKNQMAESLVSVSTRSSS